MACEKRRLISMDHAEALVELVPETVPLYRTVSTYFEGDTEWRVVVAEVADKKSRSIRFSQIVIDNSNTDSPRLIPDLRGIAIEDFLHPNGCVVRVRHSSQPHLPGGYWIRRDTLDGKPSVP